MRIAVASSGLGHITRGVEAWAEDLAAELHQRGVAVTLFKGSGVARQSYEHVISCWKRDARAAERVTRVARKIGGWRWGLATGYGVEQTTFGLGLLGPLKDGHFDLVHTQDPDLAAFLQNANTLGFISTPVILAHGTNESDDFLNRIEYLQHLAPYHLEALKARGVWKPEWTAIPNFIDTQRFAPNARDTLRDELGIPAEARVVLSVAAIKREHKRVDHVIREVAQLRVQAPRLPVWLILAGGSDAETESVLAEGRERLGESLKALVRFPRERIPQLYRSADVFVLGSLREMMPVALLEATSSGLPCVVNRHPLFSWMTGDGGVAIDMMGEGFLAGMLKALLCDDPRRLAMGQAARQHCMANFSRDRVVAQILAYYREINHERASIPGRC